MPIIFANVIQDAFGPLISVFEAVLVAIHSVVGSWGLSIIGLTIAVRIVTLPLTIKQFEGLAKMQQHMPELKAIQERYKDDKQRQQEEMMKFYKENNVNPLASCLPLLLPLPVLVSLFYMLRLDLKKHICGAQMKIAAAQAHTVASNAFIQKHSCDSVAHGSAKFLFISDVTTKATGGVLIALIALYIGSQLFSSLLTSVNADRNQRMIALGLPFLFTIFVIQFPAGLVLYWITTNLATIAQQYVVRRRVGHLMPARGGKSGGSGEGEDGGAGRGGPPGGGGDARAAQDGRAAKGALARRPAAVGAGTGGRAAPPPRPPRKKKKRSGRRR
jgi:YidC/Oxa1 family membrane protein insertase